jgi:hypothetical protein
METKKAMAALVGMVPEIACSVEEPLVLVGAEPKAVALVVGMAERTAGIKAAMA